MTQYHPEFQFYLANYNINREMRKSKEDIIKLNLSKNHIQINKIKNVIIAKPFIPSI